jgi:maleamate amidohydrolase
MPDLPRKSHAMGSRPALVLVDLCIGFTNPGSPLGSECDAAVNVNATLLQAFRKRGLPIFFTTVCYRSDRQASVFRERIAALNILTPESEWVRIDSRVQPLPGETVIEKQFASAFFGTLLAQQLEDQAVDSLVVTGLTTSGCVRATAVDGLQNNYRVFVVSDAVDDRNREAHAASLHDLNAKYADVIVSGQVLSALQSGVQA